MKVVISMHLTYHLRTLKTTESSVQCKADAMTLCGGDGGRLQNSGTRGVETSVSS